jgi:hypothetical protein
MRLLLALALALTATPAVGAPPLEMERELAKTASQRDARLAEKQKLQAQAAAVAERVAALKGPDTSAGRASGELSRQLRDFDRLAGRLDDVERDLAALEQRLTRLRAAFEAAADAEERRLEEEARRRGAATVAAQIDALRDARRRAAGHVETPAFRPPLDIAVSPLDGPAEIEAKLTLIDGERTRIASYLAERGREDALLATRLDAKREWARQLAAARRDAAGSVELLDRGYEEAQAALRDLAARGAALIRERAALEEAQQRLATRRTEAEARLAELRKGR